jgi:hypothetical protein
MSSFSKKALFWAPRVLTIAFIAFLSLFALDVFDGHNSFWQTALAFIIHLIPVFVLIAALILAWRWEWVGAALYGFAGLLDIAWVVSTSRPPFLKMIMILLVACPAIAIAGLFLANWLKRGELRAAER